MLAAAIEEKEIELTDFEKKAEEAIDDCKGAVKHCMRNALKHLRLAWKIKDTDPAMALFRAITAEEEAASSIFNILKNQKYKNAERIHFRNHMHKQAVFPFLRSVVCYLKELNEHNGVPFEKYHLEHAIHNRRKAMQLHLKPREADVILTPIPPLHFNIADPKTKKVFTFETTFNKLHLSESFDTALDYVKHISNLRNTLLYANERGCPIVEGNVEDYLLESKRKVFVMVYLALLIDPWLDEGHSAFVQQALDGFLLLLNKIDQTDVCLAGDHGK